MKGLKKRRSDWTVRPRFAVQRSDYFIAHAPIVYPQPAMRAARLKAIKVRKVQRKGKKVYIPIL